MGRSEIAVGMPGDDIQAVICGEERVQASGRDIPGHALFERIVALGGAALSAAVQDHPDSGGGVRMGGLAGVRWNMQMVQTGFPQLRRANKKGIRAAVYIAQPTFRLQRTPDLPQSTITQP